MKYKILFISVAVTALLLLSCGQEQPITPQLTQSDEATALAKKAMRTPFTATTPLTITDPGDIRELPNGTLHFRDQIRKGPVSGDLENNDFDAVIVVIEKAKLDVLGNGPGRGTFKITACHTVLGCGTFEGRFKGRNTGFLFADKFKAKGTSGDFVGMKMKGNFAETTPGSNVFVLTGTIR
ncbi:MAG: hypothetical protein ACE5HS_11395 [bacterium]